MIFTEKNCNATVAISCDIISHAFEIGKHDDESNGEGIQQQTDSAGI